MSEGEGGGGRGEGGGEEIGVVGKRGSEPREEEVEFESMQTHSGAEAREKAGGGGKSELEGEFEGGEKEKRSEVAKEEAGINGDESGGA